LVKGLHLWVNYSKKDGLSSKDLYNKTPVTFQFVDTNTNLGPNGEKLEIILKDNQSFQLKEASGVVKNFRFANTLKRSFGTWKLVPTTNLKNYLGSVIQIHVQDPDLVSDAIQSHIKVALENKDAPFVNLSMS